MSKTITIYLDAAFDLAEAGEPVGAADVAAFEKAYRQAADEVSQLSGVGITVETGGGQPTDDFALNNVWQDLHDCLERKRAGGWAIIPSAVKGAAALLRLCAESAPRE